MGCWIYSLLARAKSACFFPALTHHRSWHMCIPSKDCFYNLQALYLSSPSQMGGLGLWRMFFRSFLQRPVIFCRNSTPQGRQKTTQGNHNVWKFPHQIFSVSSSYKVVFEWKQLLFFFFLSQYSIFNPFLTALPHAIMYLAPCFRRQVVEIINLFCKQILRKENFEAGYPVKQ